MAIYMQIQGINGDVTATGYENWIRLESINFGVGRDIRSVEPGDQTNREESVPNFSEISITKLMDQASPNLFTLACIGPAQTSVLIYLSRGGTGGAFQNYMQYTLSDVLISSYSVSTDRDSDPLENLTLSFDKLQMVYIPFNNDGAAQSQIPAGYDLTLGNKI